jgi:hypothetical protein
MMCSCSEIEKSNSIIKTVPLFLIHLETWNYWNWKCDDAMFSVREIHILMYNAVSLLDTPEDSFIDVSIICKHIYV